MQNLTDMEKLLNNIDIQTDVEFSRVTPRDLFNESKLLKCIGQLTLKIHDGVGLGMYHTDVGDPFIIGLMSDGYLVITNIWFRSAKNNFMLFRTLYNSKNNYPLVCTHDFCDTTVFDENGDFTVEFIDLCKEL